MKTGNPADFKGSGCKRPKAGRGTARTRSGRSPRAPRSSARPFGGSHHHRRRTAKAAVPGACSEPPVSGHPCPPILFLGPEVAAMNRAFPFLSVPSGGSAPSVPAVFPCLLSLPDRLSHLLRAGPPHHTWSTPPSPCGLHFDAFCCPCNVDSFLGAKAASPLASQPSGYPATPLRRGRCSPAEGLVPALLF